MLSALSFPSLSSAIPLPSPCLLFQLLANARLRQSDSGTGFFLINFYPVFSYVSETCNSKGQNMQ